MKETGSGGQRERELTRANASTGILELTSRRKLKQPIYLNTQALYLSTTIMCLLNYITQTLWLTFLQILHCITALLRRRIPFPCCVFQARHHLLKITATLFTDPISISSSQHKATQQNQHQNPKNTKSPATHFQSLILTRERSQLSFIEEVQINGGGSETWIDWF